MKMKLKYWILGLALLPLGLQAQDDVQAQFKQHISYLASDQLEGRETGTKAELVAADYVKSEMEKLQMSPKGSNGFLQEFEFLNRLKPSKSSSLSIGGEKIMPGAGFEIFPQSGDGDFSGSLVSIGFGIQAPQLGHDDYKNAEIVKGKVALIMRGTPDGDNPHGKFGDFSPIDVKLATAAKMGAIGVVFVNPDNQEMEAPMMNYGRKTAREKIPAVWVEGKKADDLAGTAISGHVALEEDMRKGHNVVGYMDYGKATTIILGAHMDHLGYGEEGSLHRGERAVHNGADDNASGVAMILELAEAVRNDAALQNHNYLFIAFSGEEKGLLGSNYFVKNPTINLSDVTCMLNFDMVGRLDNEKNTLGINAVGTSPFWKPALEKIKVEDMKVKTAESGVGPSDHTSFYLKDIPVLHFFSGTHSDYHKPSDDENLINYHGMFMIYQLVKLLMADINTQNGKLEFTQTKNDEEGEAPRWKVSLGVVPDYLYDGEGMRIDGVTDGKPASKAGLLAGDVVVKMGDHEVKDMMGYMRALSKFEKGDQVTVTVLRKGKAKKKKVTF